MSDDVNPTEAQRCATRCTGCGEWLWLDSECEVCSVLCAEETVTWVCEDPYGEAA